MEEITKPKRVRRSHWQVLASKKLRYAFLVAGDGEWLALSRCARRWRYWLFSDQLAAMGKELELDRNRCSADCCQRYSIFRLIG